MSHRLTNAQREDLADIIETVQYFARAKLPRAEVETLVIEDLGLKPRQLFLLQRALAFCYDTEDAA